MAIIQPDSIGSEGFKGLGLGADWKARNLTAAAGAWLGGEIDRQQGRMIIWAPVFLISGIYVYFNLWFEPSWIVAALAGGVALLLMVLGRNHAAAVALALVLAGFAIAKIRQEIVYTPLLRAVVAQSDISGFVADADNRGGSRRILTIELASATNIPDGEMPRRVRITTYNAPDALIGDFVRFKAALTPLQLPVLPGGFDFGRDLYFQSVGALGRNLSSPVYEQRPVPWQFIERRLFHQMRSAMGARITSAIPGPIGAFANSIITGERANIPKEMMTSLQISGLAHIISISGLHMSLVAGAVFWAVRALLALFPVLALNYPIKKWAAVAALIVGLIYMLLADSGSPTERSYIMIAVMFFAILVDRPAFSIRNLALSAIIVLVFTPEEAMGASFQMSFLAVLGLVAFFESWKRKPPEAKAEEHSKLWRYSTAIGRGVGAAVITTLVAGSFSSIAAAYHFGRMAPYGTVANAVTLPVVDGIVMPAALVSAIVMPLGLESWPLKIVEWGLRITMWVSDGITTWPGANVIVPHPSLPGISLMIAGTFILCLILGRLRWIGLALMVAGLWVGQSTARPQVIIEDHGGNVAIMDHAGHYVLADPFKAKFAAEKWLANNGEVETAAAAAARDGWTCLEAMCFSDLAPMSIGYFHQQPDDDWVCPPVDIVIADFPLHYNCKEAKLRIDRFDVWKHGAHALYFEGSGVRVETVKDAQGARPWVFEVRAKPKP